MKVQLDMYQTLAIAVLVLLLGSYLRKKIKFLERFCIPAPVVGGLLFAIFTCICYVTHILEFSFDDTLKEVCMVFFFTSVGFQANLKVLKKGGKSMVIFLGLVIVLIFIQNGVAVGLSKVIGLDSLIGMCTGSIPMVGGHGTAGAFGPVLEDFNVKGATTICTAAATFGLIFGSLVGGPLGKRLIEKKNLLDTAIPEDDSLLIEDEKKHERHSRMYASAVFQLIIAIGIGTIFSWALTKTGLTFPIYIGAMIAAALMRNIAEYAGNGKLVIHMGEINDLGGISLSLFLGMAMITLKLWQLASLALPLVILLGAQIMVIVLFTYFIVFNIMGRDYDAAVLVAGTCGFGMGATPNAMANMQAVCDKYVPSVKAYLLIPLIGSLFADFLNSLVITFFYQYIIIIEELNMFNIFKKVKNKVDTSEKDYSLSYDNLAIPEIHKKDSDSEKDDADISSDIVPDDNTDKPHVTYDSLAVPEVHFRKNK
nr:sodium/glutamate symporter [Lachnospira eligens]